MIGGLQKLTLLDYPGKTACTVFFMGCNFRCPFCHNASLVLPDQWGTPENEQTVLAFLKKRQGLLDGVCVTGGEPLLCSNLFSFLQNIKDLGYDVKLDTNGSKPKKLKEAVRLGLVDYVAMDLKNSPGKYGKTVGISKDQNPSGLLETVKESVSFLLKNSVDYEFRTTVVKGFHTPKDMEEIGQWILGAEKYYIQNFSDSGNLVGKEKMDSFLEEELLTLKKAVEPYVSNVFIRG